VRPGPNFFPNFFPVFEDYSLQKGDLNVLIRQCPILKCPTCNFSWCLATYVSKDSQGTRTRGYISKAGFAVVKLHWSDDPRNRYPVFDSAIFDRLEKGQKNHEETVPKLPNRTFAHCKLKFLYDPRDYYYIPGLYRSSEDGYLTPVFFNKEVLLKYIHHPNYAADLASDTSGIIHTEDGRFVSFGINRSGRVVMWLGDIGTLPENEQHYLRSENIDSDHDIASEFYESQIEVIFTNPSKERIMLRARHEMIKRALEIFSVKVAHLELETVPILKQMIRPVVWDRQTFGRVIDAMNKIMIESIDNKGLRSDLFKMDASFDPKSLKGISLFRAWLERKGFTDVEQTISPLIALNGFRIVFDHLLSSTAEQERLSDICGKLRLPPDCRNWEEIYDTLIVGLQKMYERIFPEFKSVDKNAE
jgi:hypothetical protein